MDIVLYSTHCPRCNVLTKKLNAKNVKYKEINDEKIMETLGFYDVPILVINGQIYDFKKANDWINTL